MHRVNPTDGYNPGEVNVDRVLQIGCFCLKQTVKKRMLFKKTRLYNIQIFHKVIYFQYRTKQMKTTETNKVNYLN